MIRHFKTILILGLTILFLSACGRESRIRVIKLGHALSADHPVHKAMVYMAERVKEKSNGRLRIDIYPSQQLGTERELLELLQIGSLGITKVSSGAIEGFVPVYKVFGIPYLFRDDDHRFNILEGEIGRQILLSSEKYWLRGLCYYDAGSRSFYTKTKPILHPDDLIGLKIRTMNSPTAVGMIQQMGGSATPIFLPVVMQLGINPIHFGIMMVLNLCVGLCTPPVGSVLFIGCGIANCRIDEVIKPLLPLFVAMIIALMLVTFIPEITMLIPRIFGY